MNEAKLIMDTPEEDPVETENKKYESRMSNEDAANNSHVQNENESSKCIFLFHLFYPKAHLLKKRSWICSGLVSKRILMDARRESLEKVLGILFQ